MDKDRRQRAIRVMVGTRAVSSQQELVDLLRRKGILATQASVSRDVRELGLVKIDGRYVPPDRVSVKGRGPAELRDLHHVNELITSVEPVGANLVIVKTAVGAAGPVAAALDRKASGEIAGTIAGDDTIFAAVRSRSHQGRLLAMLRGWIRGAVMRPSGASNGRTTRRRPGDHGAEA